MAVLQPRISALTAADGVEVSVGVKVIGSAVVGVMLIACVAA